MSSSWSLAGCYSESGLPDAKGCEKNVWMVPTSCQPSCTPRSSHVPLPQTRNWGSDRAAMSLSLGGQRGWVGAVTRQPAACVRTQDTVTLTVVLTLSKSFNPFKCHSPHLPSVGENIPSPAGTPELLGTHVESTSQCLCRGVLLDQECWHLPWCHRDACQCSLGQATWHQSSWPRVVLETGEPCPASLDIRSAEKAGLRWDWA